MILTELLLERSPPIKTKLEHYHTQIRILTHTIKNRQWHHTHIRIFKVDSLQIIVVARKYIYLSQLFISRMPKMRAIPQYDTRSKNELRHHLSKNNPLNLSNRLNQLKIAHDLSLWDSHAFYSWGKDKRLWRYRRYCNPQQINEITSLLAAAPGNDVDRWSTANSASFPIK